MFFLAGGLPPPEPLWKPICAHVFEGFTVETRGAAFFFVFSFIFIISIFCLFSFIYLDKRFPSLYIDILFLFYFIYLFYYAGEREGAHMAIAPSLSIFCMMFDFV